MKKRKFLAVLLLVLCLALSACSSGSDSLVGSSSIEANGDTNYGPNAFAPEFAAEKPEYDGVASDSDYFSGSSSGSYYDNTKVIRTADLSLQATDFDAAVEALNTLVRAQNGYYESSDFTYGSYSGGGNRWANFTIRVPKEHFDAFMSAVGDVAHVVDRSTGVQDVGQAYYDAELHLATLNTKHERLLALLEKAELMEDIISLESALSDVEYQIQQYTSTLTRYDSLIDFSTIRLSLREVIRVSETTTEADPLSQRIGAAFSRGWHNFCDGLADFAVWAAYNFVGIVIFLAILAGVVTVLLRVRKRRPRRHTAVQQPKDPDNLS